jgi:carboxypeptidase Q
LRKVSVVLIATFVFQGALAFPQERADLDRVTKIRLEGFRDSKVMETSSHLMDSIGPRLTGSPNIKKANEWTRKQLEDWGLSNAHLESWGPFGRGWSYEQSTVRMISPDRWEMLALPVAWTPGTNGPLRAAAVKYKLTEKEDLEKARGKLAGKILLLGELREIHPQEKALSERYDEKTLADLSLYEIPGLTPFRRAGQPVNREDFLRRRQFQRELAKFLVEEKVAAVIEPGPQLEGGTFRVQGVNNGWKKDAPPTIPTVVLAIEHYGRMARMLDRKEDVQLELNVQTRFHDEDAMAYNTLAEIPGSDKSGQVVMLGAHMDSWHGGTGATDNGAGVVVAMEAMRILKALNVHPKRTIRIALWSGEEQGLLGSRAYVAQHFGSRAKPPESDSDLPSYLRPPSGAVTVKPDHAKLSAYFNIDNGTGKIRGIYAQENAAVVPIFEAWMQPLRDLGVTMVTMRNTGGTDHLSFDEVGLPGFQFIQDEVEYETRTHHTNMDVYERLQRADLMQASVVMACFVWEAAERSGMMPRKPMPKEPPRREQEPPREKGPLARPEPARPSQPLPAPTPSGGAERSGALGRENSR